MRLPPPKLSHEDYWFPIAPGLQLELCGIDFFFLVGFRLGHRWPPIIRQSELTAATTQAYSKVDEGLHTDRRIAHMVQYFLPITRTGGNCYALDD